MFKSLITMFVLLILCIGNISFTASAQDDDCFADLDILTTSDGIEYVRTPDACFENLVDWDYEPKYLEIDGLRQAYVDEGPSDADPILLLHGQPSWSYLYRYMIPVLVDGGHRVIAMDHLGMGRSDKPIDVEYHTFENHVNRLEAFITELELDNLTLFAQDWGSVIGLYSAGINPDLYARIVLGNGGLPVVEEVAPFPDDIDASNLAFDQLISFIPPNQPPFFDEEGNSLLPSNGGVDGGFGQWAAYALYFEDFRPSKMVEALTYDALTPEELQAYDAPFPTEITMAGPRSFPNLLNTLVGVLEPAQEGLLTYDKPFLTIFGGNDPGLAGEADVQDELIETIPGAEGQAHHRFPDASHFLQDDKGEEIAGMVNQFIADNPIEG
ncbi:MAG: haloalkane dehalogenase [Chloroflexota bacterium]